MIRILLLFLVVFFILLDDNLLIKELNFSFLDHNVELRSFSYFFTIFAVICLTNAFNFIDGIDGLAISVIALFLLLFEFILIKLLE